MLVLDATSVRAWATECVRSLQHLRAEIDGINVYPVADSDTGSNMLHTLLGADESLDGAEPARRGAGDTVRAGRALDVFAAGAVRAARGNSGVILAQVLRGMAESVGDATEIDARALAGALANADAVASAAVARPVSGTMLSVLHAAASAVRDGSPDELGAIARAAASAASEALGDTPRQLPVLAQAGVVDAGGRGLVVVLESLVRTITGERPAPEHAESTGVADAPTARVPAWEVMYLLDGADGPSAAVLRGRLAELGDSVSVADDGAGTCSVHVHCADIGAAIEAGLELGRPHRVRVEPLLPAEPVSPVVRRARGVVVLVRGEALAGFLEQEGVTVLRVEQEVRPSAEELLGLIREAAVEQVTVLPGGSELTATAEEVAAHGEFDGRDVVVVPCVSPVQVLAALAVHDPGRRANDDVVAMAEAAAATRRGELRIAGEESLTWVGTAYAGDAVGLVDGEVVLIEQESASEAGLVDAAQRILDRMLALGGELVTVLTGTHAPTGIDAELRRWVDAEHPEADLMVYPGGQEDAVLLIGVE